MDEKPSPANCPRMSISPCSSAGRRSRGLVLGDSERRNLLRRNTLAGIRCETCLFHRGKLVRRRQQNDGRSRRAKNGERKMNTKTTILVPSRGFPDTVARKLFPLVSDARFANASIDLVFGEWTMIDGRVFYPISGMRRLAFLLETPLSFEPSPEKTPDGEFPAWIEKSHPETSKKGAIR